MNRRSIVMGLPLALLATQARAQGSWAPSRPVVLVVPVVPVVPVLPDCCGFSMRFDKVM